MHRILSAALLLMAIVACSRGGTLGGPVGIAVNDPYGGAPSWEEIAVATYEGIAERPITLKEGRWQGEPFVDGGASRPSIGLVDDGFLVGDLDGDGGNETVALLWESSGGSGNRIYLAAMARRNGEVINLGTVLIGDRVQIRSGSVGDGHITLSIIRAGPEDAACCPTETALVAWALNDNELATIADEVTGALSLADLEGPEWMLLEFGRGQAIPEEIEISLVFEDDRISGKSGCNSYFAGALAPAPGELGFNGMGATRMACPEPQMDVERRYLKALAGASRYSFLAGRLMLSCDTDEGPQHLVFGPRESPPGIVAGGG